MIKESRNNLRLIGQLRISGKTHLHSQVTMEKRKISWKYSRGSITRTTTKRKRLAIYTCLSSMCPVVYV